jgi:hypothetical protein
MRCCRVKHFFRRECVEDRAFSSSRDLFPCRLEAGASNSIATTKMQWLVGSEGSWQGIGHIGVEQAVKEVFACFATHG